jgi:preprotein translocase subunit SecE
MKSVTQFLGEVKAEMAKVVWPSWHELVGLTIIVLVVVTAFSLYLGVIDFILSKIAGWIFMYYGMR